MSVPSGAATNEAAEADRDWTSVPCAALAVVSKHATTRTTPGGCRLARVCSGWRSMARRSGPVTIRRGASIGTSLPVCTSLSQWLGSNGAGLVCLQLQGLCSSGEGSSTRTIINGLYHAASAAAGGAQLQLQKLCLDGDSLLPAMRLLPLLPHLQQLELACVNLSVGEPPFTIDDPHDPRLQQLQEHPRITRLTISFTVTPGFRETIVYGGKVAHLLLQSACPQQLQDLTLRWQPAASIFAESVQCLISVRALAHLKQLRRLTLDKAALFAPDATPEDVAAVADVAGRLQQVKLLLHEQKGFIQHLDVQALSALLPKIVELHGTRQTCSVGAAACSQLTGINIGGPSYDTLAADVADTEQLVEDLRGLQQLRKLVLPPITAAYPYSMVLFDKVTHLGQLQELSITTEPGYLELQRLSSLQRLTSLSLLLTRSPPLISSSTGAVLWQDVGLTELTGLQHLATQAAFLAAAPPAALEALTAVTALTASFDRHWQEQLTEVAAVLGSCPALQQRLRVVYATGVVVGGVRKVYRALRRALPRTRVEVITGGGVPEWLREAA